MNDQFPSYVLAIAALPLQKRALIEHNNICLVAERKLSVDALDHAFDQAEMVWLQEQRKQAAGDQAMESAIASGSLDICGATL